MAGPGTLGPIQGRQQAARSYRYRTERGATPAPTNHQLPTAEHAIPKVQRQCNTPTRHKPQSIMNNSSFEGQAAALNLVAAQELRRKPGRARQSPAPISRARHAGLSDRESPGKPGSAGLSYRALAKSPEKP